MITWKQLLSHKEVRQHTTSENEIIDLLAVVERDLKDATLVGLSSDRRFATAYNAALQLCKLSIACKGYQVSSKAHHQKTFEFAQIAIGKRSDDYIYYFEYCRRKRNSLDYDRAGVVTEAESDELLKKVVEFKNVVIQWLQIEYPEFTGKL